jgi:hypothetical protein
MSKSIKGLSVFDFDDTLAKTKEKIIIHLPYFAPGSTTPATMKLTPSQFAEKYGELEKAGATADFSDFNNVIGAKKGPLADLALKRQGKFGSGDIFVLTARPQASANAIYIFLKGIGLNIPLKNITGLENSTPEAKADWILEKVAQGYNNFYFADDAIKNVKEVEKVLNMLPAVKSEVELAKFSKIDRSKTFNEILEKTKGVKSESRFSEVVARKKGGKKGGLKFYLPPNAEDFMGLIYAFLSRGKVGEDQKQWFIDNLIHPYARGINTINSTRQSIKNDYKYLLSKFPGLKRKLGKEIPSGDFTWDQAIRVYLWTKASIDIPGISKRDIIKIRKDVSKDKNVQDFANILITIINTNGIYPEPSQYWDSQNILSDISSIAFTVGRKDFLAEFIKNKNEIFNKENLNKIEAIYGTNFKEALEDMLWRMENGTNRKTGQSRVTNLFSTWVNNSVGAVMFFNTKSAILQTLSMVNFLNWTDNNPLKAGLALANLPQFIKDFVFIFNSNKLKQRRAGLQTGVNESEIANAVKNSTNKPRAILSYLLKKGFLPTQIADSFAIAAGGAPMYRNRVNTYLKQINPETGKKYTKQDAEAKAWEDFALIADETQQSADPMLISQIQASPLGRFIFAWQNTPFQYNRLIKKAALDLINNRGDHKTNISKIIYYGAIQNFIFSALQNALFVLLPGFNGDEDEDEEKQSQKDLAKQIRIANNMLDTILRGSGLPGAIISTIKNIILEYNKQEKKGWFADHTHTLIQAFNLSPPIGNKARKFYKGIQTAKFEKDVINERGWAYDSPQWGVVGNITAAATNIPLDRLVSKLQNVIAAFDSRNEAWQRIATMSGWPTWTVDVEPFPEHEQIKINAKLLRKEESKIKAKETRELNKKLKEEVETIIFSKSSSIQKFYKLSDEEQKEYIKKEIEKLKKKKKNTQLQLEPVI